ncbi:MAG: AIR synthase-related protein, partial [Pseudomonadota bacterium]
FPVVSGNVSLYNETNGVGIPPTPAIGGVGLIDDYARMRRMDGAEEDMAVVLLGDTRGELGQSLYLRELFGKTDGAPPAVDLVQERRRAAFIRHLLARDFPCSIHDVSDGGALVAIAEMAMASGVGARLQTPEDASPPAFWFGEDQGRYMLAVDQEFLPQLRGEAKVHGVPVAQLGVFEGDALTLDGEALALDVLANAHERALPEIMGEA